MIPTGLVPMIFDWMVAGGWAVCPALATDRDVFVLIDNPEQSEDARALILVGLRNYGFDFEPEGDLIEDIHRLQYGTKVLKVAKVEYCGSIIHVLIGFGSAKDVLDSFDLSICQVGIMSDGTLVKGSGYTSPVEEIRILRMTPTTDARAEKYKARFNLSAVEV